MTTATLNKEIWVTILIARVSKANKEINPAAVAIWARVSKAVQVVAANKVSKAMPLTVTVKDNRDNRVSKEKFPLTGILHL